MPPGFLAAACAAIAMVSVMLGTVGPLLPRLEAEQHHSGLFAGLVIAGHPIGSLLMALPIVFLTRRFGLPRLILAGAIVGLCSSVLFVWPGGWWAVGARIGHGVAAAVVWQSVFAWTITNAGPSRRARAIGTLMAAATAAGLIGPQIGGAADRFGLWLVLVPGVLLVVAASRFARLPAYEQGTSTDLGRLKRALLTRSGVGGLGLTSAGAVVNLAVAVTMPLALHARGASAFGIAATVTLASAGTAVLNPFVGKFIDLRGMRPMLLAGYTGLAIAAGLLAVTDGTLAFPLAVMLLCLNGTLGLPSNVLVSRTVANAHVDQIVAQTVTTLAWGPAAIAGALLAGVLPSPNIALGGVAVVCTLFALGVVLASVPGRAPAPERA